MKKTKIKCKNCGKEFEIYTCKITYGQGVFCCRKCMGEYYKAKPNEIILKENYAEIVIKTKKNGTVKSKIDLEDVEKVKDHSWVAIKHPHVNNFYIYLNSSTKHLKLHRYLMNCPEKLVIDHINHDTLDNRKCNLRICTIAENNKNSGFYKNNTSGYKNIRWHKKNNTWAVYSGNKYLGCRKNIEDAIKLRDEKRA